MSDQRLQTRGGERWPGWERRRCGALFPSRRFKPLRPGVPTARRWATVMVLPAPVTGQPAMIGARSGGKVLAAKAGGPERRVHQGRCGADLSNTARGTPWDLADLRFNGLQHASMLRGVEVRGSSGPKSVPRALGTHSGAADMDCGLRLTRGRPKNTGDDARQGGGRRRH